MGGEVGEVMISKRKGSKREIKRGEVEANKRWRSRRSEGKWR